MKFTAAVISVRKLTLAAILVTPEQTYPEPGARLVAEAQRVFPALPILLIAPTEGGFSRSFAHFDTADIVAHLDTRTIAWRPYATPAGGDDTGPLPF